MAGNPEVGKTIADRYRITAEIGRGGMGAVFEAEDLALERAIAIKLLLPAALADRRARAQFQEEISSSVKIEHPHVVPIYDAGFDGDHFYIAMRLVRSPDLSALIHRSGPMEEARAMKLLGQIANALDAVHREGLVHRDVKPANVLVWGASAPDEHCFLTDFGIAKALDDTGTLSAAGPIGTPGYMAPEVCAGLQAGAQSDQYSLACLTYEMLSGRLPFEGVGVLMLEAHMKAQPRSLQSDAPHVTAPVREAVERALEKSPGDRFPSVKAFASAASASKRSFEQSEAITTTMSSSKNTQEMVTTLHDGAPGLTDRRIAEIVQLNRSRVVRLRRRAARQALIGNPSTARRNTP